MKDAPREYGPYKTLYNRFIRWSRLGVFNKIFAELVEQNGSTTRLMIDSTHLKAHRTAASLLKKGAFPDVSDIQKGGLNSKLHAVCNASGQPIAFHLTSGQVSDYKGASVLLASLPQSRELLADRGYDAEWFRNVLSSKGITPCIPGRRKGAI